ncbi:hypothetical protein SEA_LEOPARD_99 [Mycobacterium phage Leopard]|nr:hypothetical protein SEA_LEOPARD_99 [Mycobacterium phage Leopard]
MNEQQHDALREYDQAVAQVRLKNHELRAARKAAVEKQSKLVKAIRADPASWENTPMKDRLKGA